MFKIAAVALGLAVLGSARPMGGGHVTECRVGNVSLPLEVYESYAGFECYESTYPKLLAVCECIDKSGDVEYSVPCFKVAIIKKTKDHLDQTGHTCLAHIHSHPSSKIAHRLNRSKTFAKCVILLCAVIAFGWAAELLFPDNELECYSQEKVYHGESGKCYKLLTKGPCEDTEWLVLERPSPNDRNPGIKAVCAKEKCEESKYYWPRTRSCLEAKDKAMVCGAGEELQTNVFGEGECACSREPLRVRFNRDKDGSCYQLYLQGPCRVGQVLAVPDNETEPVCVEDKCREERIRRKKNGELSEHGILAPSKNGSCYELGTQGPCENDKIYKVHSNYMRASCVSLIATVFNIQRPQNCYQDENGDCQQRVNVNRRKDAEKFKKELLNSIRH